MVCVSSSNSEILDLLAKLELDLRSLGYKGTQKSLRIVKAIRKVLYSKEAAEEAE